MAAGPGPFGACATQRRADRSGRTSPGTLRCCQTARDAVGQGAGVVARRPEALPEDADAAAAAAGAGGADRVVEVGDRVATTQTGCQGALSL